MLNEADQMQLALVAAQKLRASFRNLLISIED
jgi:hypothetical protein